MTTASTRQYKDFSEQSSVSLIGFFAIGFKSSSGAHQTIDEATPDSVPVPLAGIRSCDYSAERDKWVVKIGSVTDLFAYENGEHQDLFAPKVSDMFGRTFLYGDTSRKIISHRAQHLPGHKERAFTIDLEFEVGEIFRKNISHAELENSNIRFANISRLKTDLLDDIIDVMFEAGGRRLGVNTITTGRPVLKGPLRVQYIASNADFLHTVLGRDGVLKNIDVLVHPLRIPVLDVSAYPQEALVEACLVRDSELVKPKFAITEHQKLMIEY